MERKILEIFIMIQNTRNSFMKMLIEQKNNATKYTDKYYQKSTHTNSILSIISAK